MQPPLAARRDQLIARQRLQDVQPVRALARGRQSLGPKLVQPKLIPKDHRQPTRAPLARPAQPHLAQPDRNHVAVEGRRDAVLGEKRDLGRASAGRVALGEDGDLDVFADPVGERDRASELLVGVADVEAGADVDLDRLVELRRGELGHERQRLGGRVLAFAVDLPELLGVTASVAHRGDVHPHRAGRPGDDLGRLLDVVGVEVLELALGDVAELLLGDGADLRAVGLGRALVDVDRLTDQHRRRGGLGHERERAVLVDGDHDRDDGPRFARGLGVEGLAELHDVDPVLAQGRADRRGRARLPGVGLELDRG